MPIFTVPIHEFNPCHEPGGSPVGGQFATGRSGNCALGQGVTVIRGDFDFNQLGQTRRFMFHPTTGHLILGDSHPGGADGMPDVSVETGFSSHAEEFEAAGGRARLGHYDAHVKGWLWDKDAAGNRSIQFYPASGHYLPGGKDDPEAALFDAVTKALERFVGAGAPPTTDILGLDRSFRQYERVEKLGEAFPEFFKRRRAS